MATETDVAGSYTSTLQFAGYKDDSDSADSTTLTATKLRAWFSDSYRAQRDFRANVVDSLKCLGGDQWPEDVLSKLPPGMAPIVINKMLMPVLFLSGVQRQTRSEPKLVPFEGGDARSAELMNALVHWVETQAGGDQKDSQVFLDKMSIGMGWWKYTVDFDQYDDLEGKICLYRRHPLAIFPDPNWLDTQWEDAQYVIDAQWYTPAEAGERWPAYKDEFLKQPGEWLSLARADGGGGMGGVHGEAGDPFSDVRLFFDPVTKRVRVAECWYKVKQHVTIAVNGQTGDVEGDQDKVDMMKQLVKQLPRAERGLIQFIPRTVTMVRVGHLFMDTLLDDDDSPHDQPCFPIFPSLGMYFWKDPFGLADMMKDLQREKNKRRSKLIELTGRMPLSGFFHKNSEVQTRKDIEDYGQGNGVSIGYDVDPPTQIHPPDLPMALIRLEEKADAEIKDVPNVHNELLGQATQKTISGKAIEARQRGGLVSHEILFETFRTEKEQCIKFLIGLIKQYISPTKALRILGTIATRTPDSPVAQMMSGAQPGSLPPPTGTPTSGLPPAPMPTSAPPGSAVSMSGSVPPPGPVAPPPPDPQQAMMDILAMLGKAFDAEYDVVIASRPAEPSLALEAWETLSEMKKEGAEIPPKVLYGAAQKAGVLTESDVADILAYIQQQQQLAGSPPPGGGPPPGAPPPGPPPMGPPQSAS